MYFVIVMGDLGSFGERCKRDRAARGGDSGMGSFGISWRAREEGGPGPAGGIGFVWRRRKGVSFEWAGGEMGSFGVE